MRGTIPLWLAVALVAGGLAYIVSVLYAQAVAEDEVAGNG